MNDTNRQAIATTIWSQIPIGIKMACGARDAKTGSDCHLCFKVERRLWIEVTLNGRDLYDVECIRLKRGTYERVTVAVAQDVYAEDLGETVYHMVNR